MGKKKLSNGPIPLRVIRPSHTVPVDVNLTQRDSVCSEPSASTRCPQTDTSVCVSAAHHHPALSNKQAGIPRCCVGCDLPVNQRLPWSFLIFIPGSQTSPICYSNLSLCPRRPVEASGWERLTLRPWACSPPHLERLQRQPAAGELRP